MNNPTPVLALRQINQIYTQVDQPLAILQNVNFDLYAGQIVALVAPSGAGKSTLLHISGLLDQASSGQIWIAGRQVDSSSDRQRTDLRRQSIGFVYQFHHLLPEFTALENLVVPQMIAGTPKKQAMENAEYWLGRVGLSHRLSHRPAKLSGGEQQRVAIARALVNRPKILLADEPTGNLDPETGSHVFQLLFDIVREDGLAALVATHNPDLARRMDRIVTLHQGQIYDIEGYGQ